MPVQVRGLKELRAALKEAADATPREITKALKEGAVTVAARANAAAPKETGKLAANGKPYATQRAAGVRYTLVYAPVQEFGTTWLRRNRGSGLGSVSKGEKKAHFAGGVSSGSTNEVHYTTPTPRFAFKTINELGPELIDETFDRLVEILKAHGWFRE